MFTKFEPTKRSFIHISLLWTDMKEDDQATFLWWGAE